MSPYQSQVIDASLGKILIGTQQIREQQIRDQQAKLGQLGSGRAGVQLAELGTGLAREIELHYKQDYYNKVLIKHLLKDNKIFQIDLVYHRQHKV